MFSSTSYIVVLFLISAINADSLPTYFDQCSLSDPNLNNCIRDNANRAMLHVVRGDPQYNVPDLSPLLTAALPLQNSQDLNFTLVNTRIYEMEMTRILDVDFNVNQGTLRFTVNSPRVTTISNYEIGGTLLGQAVNGAGRANITYFNPVANILLNFQVSSDNFMYIFNPTGTIVLDSATFQLTNLNNGDANAGTTINNLMNSNWDQLAPLINPNIADFSSQLVSTVFQCYSDLVPFNRMFLN